MRKIKTVGALVFILSIVLSVLFIYTSKENLVHNNFTNSINKQKDFTQEISKNIFYIYKNKDASTETLDSSVKHFLEHMKNQNQAIQSKEIIMLWNDFYLHVEHFRDQMKNSSIYSTILIEKSVKNIYNTNLKLIIEFDKLIKTEESNFNKEHNIYKQTQYMLFFILVLLLMYLFTQLKNVITFIQTFLLTSKSIITNSSIKELKPIEINDSDSDISQASDNFNTLVEKINSSVEHSSSYIEHSYKSLEIVEQHIEELVELIYTMNENSRDKELRNKEDAVIQSLEELSSTAKNLKNLKDDLDNLIVSTK
jgi:methyl-accepting chemotaxis protein